MSLRRFVASPQSHTRTARAGCLAWPSALSVLVVVFAECLMRALRQEQQPPVFVAVAFEHASVAIAIAHAILIVCVNFA